MDVIVLLSMLLLCDAAARLMNVGSSFGVTTSNVLGRGYGQVPFAASLLGTISSIAGIDVSGAFAARVMSVPAALAQPSLLTQAAMVTAPVQSGASVTNVALLFCFRSGGFMC